MLLSLNGLKHSATNGEISGSSPDRSSNYYNVKRKPVTESHVKENKRKISMFK